MNKLIQNQSINKLKSQNRLLVLFTVVIAFMLVGRDIGGLSINKYLYLLVCAGFMIEADFQTLCCMICFLIPLFNGLPGTYIRILAVVLLIMRNKGRIKAEVFNLIVFFLVLEFLASIWYPRTDVIDVISYLSTLLLTIFLIKYRADINCEKCLGFFTIGTAIFCLIVVATGILSSNNNWIDMISNVQLRFGEVEKEGMHISANANALGYYCIAGCFTSFYLAKKGIWKRGALYYLLSGFIAIVGCLSLSRSYVIVFLLTSLIYLIVKLSDYRKALVTISAVVVIVGVVFLLIRYNSVASGIWKGLLIRFNRSDVISGNGRTDALAMYNKAFFSNMRFLFIGTGVTQYRSVMGIDATIHNMFQQILICYGFFGAFVFLISFFKPVVELLKEEKSSLVDALPLLSIILVAQTIQFINPYQYMLVYVAGIFVLQAASKRGGEM